VTIEIFVDVFQFAVLENMANALDALLNSVK
jgi:hypothetical protein